MKPRFDYSNRLFLTVLFVVSVAMSFGAVQEYMLPDGVTPRKVSTANPLPTTATIASVTITASGSMDMRMASQTVPVYLRDGVATSPLYIIATGAVQAAGPTGFATDPLTITGNISGSFNGGTATQPFTTLATQTGIVSPVFDGYATVGSASAVTFASIVAPTAYTVPCIIKIGTTQDVRVAAVGTATSTQQWCGRIVADTAETYKLVATTTWNRQYICGTYTATLSVTIFPIQ